MRMLHYFAGLAVTSVPALIATALVGVWGDPGLHLRLGIPSAILTVGLHSLLILFMIVTGRVLKEAMASRPLPAEFLEELNVFFSKKAAYPAAVFAAMAITFAAVLGYGGPALGLPPLVHPVAGVLALGFHVWALRVEFAALRDNQHLIDRAAAELDLLDAQAIRDGDDPAALEAAPPDAPAIARAGAIVSVSAWKTYLYWVKVEWRGDFTKTSLHPWLEVSVIGAAVWLFARRGSSAAEQAPSE